MTCDDCIHKSICYRRIESISTSYADKCGDFMHDNNIESFKPMVEIDLYSVIKQKYIEREVLDKIRAEIKALPRELPTDARNMVRRTRVLEIIDKYKAESEDKE